MLTFNNMPDMAPVVERSSAGFFVPCGQPKSGFKSMNIIGDEHYFDLDYRYYDPNYNVLEHFIFIPGFLNLNLVSTFGRVISFKTPKKHYESCILKPMENKFGYLKVELRDKRGYFIHKLVAMTFLPNPNNLPEINHKDLDKKNNFYLNIEWSTRSKNVSHMWDNNVRKRPVGELGFNTKLTNEQVLLIVERLKNKENPRLIAIDFNVNRSAISNIKLGKTWSHITKINKYNF